MDAADLENIADEAPGQARACRPVAWPFPRAGFGATHLIHPVSRLATQAALRWLRRGAKSSAITAPMAGSGMLETIAPSSSLMS